MGEAGIAMPFFEISGMLRCKLMCMLFVLFFLYDSFDVKRFDRGFGIGADSYHF